MRLSGIATVVAGNLAMLRWFRGHPPSDRPNVVFHSVVLGACGLLIIVLLALPLRAAFGFPLTFEPAVLPALLALAALPAAWSVWKMTGTNQLRRTRVRH